MKTSFTKFDWIIIIGIFFSVIAFIFLIVNYDNVQKNECLKSPFVFGAKQMTDKYGYEFYGSAVFQVPLNVKTPTITFNSTSINIKN